MKGDLHLIVGINTVERNDRSAKVSEFIACHFCPRHPGIIKRLEPVVGSEQGGLRPALIIQNNIGNFYSPAVIVAALSGRIETKAKMPTHHLIKANGRLEDDSLVLLTGCRLIKHLIFLFGKRKKRSKSI
ncbi:type II toxin-antitoxin system PemK/MazF family toxin [Faecalicatena contorta]|uniref:type II toxin-antitoxin system PemK/MazF family toxin n=1 Tax=Faecalicatena contorta TaxID=39482 RepID=UPI002FE6E407